MDTKTSGVMDETAVAAAAAPKKPRRTGPAVKKPAVKKPAAKRAPRKKPAAKKAPPKKAPSKVAEAGEGQDAPEAIERIGDREVHRAASVFPLNSPGQQQALEESIRRTGLLHPITLLGEVLLDGRNRLQACIKVGVKPRFASVSEDEDPVQYVLRANLHRRHLTRSQRAVAAARLAAMPEGRPSSETRQDCRFSAKQAASLFGVSARLVRGARAVRRQGVPELVRAVERGDLTVGRAEAVARAPAQRQRGLLQRLGNAGNKAEKEAVLSVVAAPKAAWARGEVPEVDPEEAARASTRDRCVRRLAGVVRDAEDPGRELAAIHRELARLVGVDAPVRGGEGDEHGAPR